MANASDDAEFNKENKKDGVNATTELDAEFCFPSEFPYEFDSFGIQPLDSPVESLVGSTETESSDEEDFFAGLTRRLSQASLHETRLSQLTVPINNSNDTAIRNKDRVISGSPQSTLSGIGSWSGWSSGSGDGSPDGSSRVPSPTATEDAWEVIFAAAGQVARLMMKDDVSRFDFHNRGVTRGFPPQNPAPALFRNQNLDLASQVRTRQEQVLKQQCGSVWGREPKANFSTHQQHQELAQVQNKGPEFGYGSVKCARPLPQSAWHPLQVRHQNQQAQVQHGGSGSRPVLHSGSGVKRGCAGTGVFLPRQYVAPPEPRKKTSCATPLLPQKVIHALNSNIDDLNATSQPRFSSAYGVDYNALLARRNAILMHQKLSLRRGEAANYEIRLPQDWTY